MQITETLAEALMGILLIVALIVILHQNYSLREQLKNPQLMWDHRVTAEIEHNAKYPHCVVVHYEYPELDKILCYKVKEK